MKLRDYYMLNLKKKINENKLVLFIINYSSLHLKVKTGLANIF